MSFDKFEFIDIHYHASPDLYERKYNAIEVGTYYKELNGAVVLKSHIGSTAVHASIAQSEGLPVFASISLNNIAGGIHYRPVLQALAEYQPAIPSKMIVDLPTKTGRKSSSKLTRQMVYPHLETVICKSETIFNSSGKLKSEILDLLKLTKDYPIILSTGHASRDEVYELLEVCNEWKISELLLNQPANPLTGFSAQDLIELSSYDFIWIEQTALTYLMGYQSKEDFSSVIKNLSRVIYSSDLGQTNQIGIMEWLEISKKWFSEFNISSQRRAELCLKNPTRLLTI